MPVIVAAFDFAFGLGGWGVAQRDAIEMECGTQLGERIRIMGVEEGVVVNVEGQRQAMDLEDTREKVKMSQERFSGVEVSARVKARGVVQKVQEDLLVGRARQPGMGAGVVLPESPQVTDLPAFDRFGGPFIAGVWGQVVLQSPTANAGAVGLELEAAVQFAGRRTIRRGRFGSEELGEQGDDLYRPVGVVIPAGSAGDPSVPKALGTGAQVVGAQLVKPAGMDIQFEGCGLSREAVGADLGQEMAD